jgi:hypothetical protein
VVFRKFKTLFLTYGNPELQATTGDGHRNFPGVHAEFCERLDADIVYDL